MNRSLMLIIGLVCYMIVMVILGYFGSKKQNKGTSFIDGGRSTNALLLFGTMAASCVGVGSSVGATGSGFYYGWAGMIINFGNACMMWLFFAYIKTRKHGFGTMSEEMQYFYGGSVPMRRFMAFICVFVECLWLGSNINGGAALIAYLTDFDPYVCKIILTLGLLAFSIIGGYMSVVWTDTIQMFIILFCFITVLIRVLLLVNGPAGIIEAYTAAGNTGAFSLFGWKSYGGKAVIAGLSAQAWALFTMPAILGMSAFVLASRSGAVIAQSNDVFAYLAMEVLGPALGLLFLIAAMSAMISSADSNVMSANAVLFNDILLNYYKKQGKDLEKINYKKNARISICILTAIAFVFAMFAGDVIAYFSTVIGALLPGIGIALIFGRFWKRATWQGGMATMIAGILMGVLYLVVSPFHEWIMNVFGGPAIPVTIVSSVVCLIVSLCTKLCTLTEEEIVAKVKEYTDITEVNV